MRLEEEGATSLLVLALSSLLLLSSLLVLVEARELDRLGAGSTCRTARIGTGLAANTGLQAAHHCNHPPLAFALGIADTIALLLLLLHWRLLRGGHAECGE